MQYLLCEYPKEEVLKIIAEHAGNNLPEDSPNGVLRARFKKDGQVEVFFLPENDQSKNN